MTTLEKLEEFQSMLHPGANYQSEVHAFAESLYKDGTLRRLIEMLRMIEVQFKLRKATLGTFRFRGLDHADQQEIRVAYRLLKRVLAKLDGDK